MKDLLWYFRTRAKMLLGKGVQISFSQFGEDVVAHSLLRNVQKGTYVDVGAFDPVLYSNTYHFYKKGWKGLVIDPNSSLRKRFSLLRPRDTFVAMGIGEREGTRMYYEFNDAAYNTFDESERDTYLKANTKLRIVRKRETQLAPLSKVLHEHSIDSLDFLSIDAQGLDLPILRSMGTTRPRLIAVEAHIDVEHLQSAEIYHYLKSLNYELVGIVGLTLLFRYKPN